MDNFMALHENLDFKQGPGAEKFCDAPAPALLLFNKLELRLRFSSRCAPSILLSSLRF